MTMRAAVMNGFGQPLRLTRLPIPTPGPGEILIRLQASGVCHSDVHVWRGDMRPGIDPDPFILGHEGAGTVAAVGAGVADWALGDRAGAAWLHDTCGTCAPCLSGQESFCQAQRAHGFNVPGTFAEYVVAKAAYAARLPEGSAGDLAPLLCAGLTAYGALARAALQPGECCAIFGCGGLGLYAVQLAKRMGAQVIAVDTDPAKLDLARSFGAAQTVSPTAGTWPLTDHPHVSINFAPTPATWGSMVAATRPLGRIIAAAMVSTPVPLSQEWLAATGITVTGTSVGTRAQLAELMALQAATPLNAQITRIALEDATDALTALMQGRASGRYCITF
jgi:propanol-preferring alcohol dehydrogenase